MDGRREGPEGGAGGRGRREGVRVELSYEAKNKRQKLRCLLLRRKKKNIFLLIYDVITWEKRKKSLSTTTTTTTLRMVLEY